MIWKKFYEQEATWKRFEDTPREFTLAENILPELPKRKVHILEIGSGDGFLSLLMNELGHKIVGVDISFNRTKNASKRVPSADFIVADINALPFLSEVFDVVICAEILEHVPKLEKAIYEARSVLKSGGHLIVTVPFRERLIETLVTCPYCLKTFHPAGHVNFFSEKSLRKSVEQGRFKVKKTYGFGSLVAYNSFTWQFPKWGPLRKLVDKLAYKMLDTATYILCIALRE